MWRNTLRLPDALMDGRRRIRAAIALLGFLLVAAAPAASPPKKIVVALGESFPPLVYYRDGEPVGVDVEIWKLWAERTGTEVELRLMPWSEALPALKRGEVDVVDGVSRTPDREADLDFSEAYGELRSFIYHDRSITGHLDLEDLKHHRTGIIDGSNVEEYLRRAVPGIQIVEFAGPEEMVASARRNEIDVFVGVDLTTEFHLKRLEQGDPIVHEGDALTASLLHMAVREGNETLLKLINRGLQQISESERREIFKNAGIVIPGSTDLRWLYWLGGSLVLAALLLFTWNAVLHRRFALATRVIKEKEARFRALIESASDWIWEVDTKAAYTYVSPRVKSLLGYEPEDTLGKTPFDLMPAEEADRVRAIVLPLMAAGMPVENVENRNLHRDGHVVLLETSGVPIRDHRGRVTGYRGVDRDITERKSLEAQLYHSQKMEAIGQLAGGVAHDFNNQLQAILGYTHVLLDRKDREELDREHLTEIRKAAERAANLTKQLLTFGRREAVRLRNRNLGMLLEGMTNLLRRVLGERVELTVRADDDLRAVRVDPGQIEQVILNLCINARDAMPEGGHITLAARNVHLDRAPPGLAAGDCVELTVCDTGTGIPENIREHIFEPFYTTKGIGEGTGLGLATAYAIVDGHHGRIEVESPAGEGATFRLLFPANDEPIDAEPVVEAAVPGSGTETILLAEDEAMVRELNVEVLTGAGYDLLVAEDGDEAVRLFDEHRDEIALVILDVVMPGRGGREVHDHIRTSRPDLPILFCSGYSYSALTKGELPPGGGELLQKPYTPMELLSKVGEMTEGE